MGSRLTLTLIARIPAAGVATFRAYEDGVLPLLERHGGALERRLRTDDGRVEIHVVSFPDAAGFAAYRADPERAALGALLTESGADLEVLTVTDVV
jgi:hypothetical protein